MRAYFVVEGPHDAEVVGCILKLFAFKRTRQLESLDEYWHSLVPRSYPIDGDLLRRVPVPSFFSRGTDSVAVHSVTGSDNIARTVKSTLLTLDKDPDGIGLVIDCDYESTAVQVWTSLQAKLDIPLGAEPGSISQGPPRAGAYVLPDNSSFGTLEQILLACAAEAYPKLSRLAHEFVAQINGQDPEIFSNADERADFIKPAGRAKATAGTIANVLRPGKAIQVSIQDNRWLKEPRVLELPLVRSFQDFIARILGEAQ